MRTRSRLLLAGLLMGFVSAAAAAEAPIELYRRGDYAAAIAAAEAQNTAESLTLAARVTLAEANLRDTPCVPCLKRGEALAQRAIAADPNRAEAYMWYSVALGYQARLLSLLQAQSGKYGERSKAALDKALQLEPRNGQLLASLGGWHIEVVRIGGSLLASALYGAKLQTGIDLYRRGIAADPERLMLPYQFALSLSGYDLNRYRGEIESNLQRTIGLMPDNAYEVVIKQRAGQLLQLLRSGDLVAYRALLRKFQGYA
jgi:hypothetical protein